MPDGSDAEKVLITTVMSKKAFRALYPFAELDQGFSSRGTGDTNSEWVMKEDIRIAEYFYTKRVKANLLKLTALCLLLSFAWNLYELYFAQSTIAFYLPQVRFWELLLGALLAYYHLHPSSLSNPLLINFSHSWFARVGLSQPNTRSVLGVVLLLISFILINSQLVFPGFWALLPTIGSLLIISSKWETISLEVIRLKSKI